MAKRIVVCFDGTWNTPAEKYVGLAKLHDNFERLSGLDDAEMQAAIEKVDAAAGVETNVCRFYRCVLRLDGGQAGPGAVAQTKWYDKGVGTDWYDRVSGGAFGVGLSRKIREGYKYLSDTYDDGDDVFVSGFSRGAYTARSFVGMIRNCGLLRKGASGDGPDSPEMLEAYELYRTRDEGPDSERALAFRRKRSARIVPIKFLGVWDTVGALGIPVESFDEFNKAQFEFHDTELSGIVENAYHAVAVDEHRQPYAATLWDPKQKLNQTLEQRWFLGAHADVGGGYEDRQLSDITLRWMLLKAQACGLKVDPAGIPAELPSRASAPISDSFEAFLGGIFRLFHTRYFRPVGKELFGQEIVDLSVRVRLQSDLTYRPKNEGLSEAIENAAP
jgi:uncharacterized protein (DUF2235 family)